MSSQKYLPWTEKHRPQVIGDVVLPEHMAEKINRYVENNTLDNIIFSGVYGIGKTTTARCLAKTLYGKHYADYVLDLNASDERNNTIVKSSITDFCKRRFGHEDIQCKYGLIILDEIDNMMSSAQHNVSNLMDTYAHKIKFIFTSNNLPNVIESIQSKCVILNYVSVTAVEIGQRLEAICDKENISYTSKACTYIGEISDGDMRQAINKLQLVCTRLKKGEIVTIENINKICDIPQVKQVVNMIVACMSGRLAYGITEVRKLKEQGYSGEDIVTSMAYVVGKGLMYCNVSQSSQMMAQLLEIIYKTLYDINVGVDSNTQLYGCLIEISRMI